MLSRITIESFKCFKEKTVIELHKDDNYTILPQNVSSGGILKGLVFVGGNGSGKSTILEALRLFLNLLFDENHIQMCFYECLLSETREFCITYEFLVQSQEISFELRYNFAKEIFCERLEKNNVLLFERVGKSARDYFETQETVYNEGLIKPDGLFLRTLYFNGRLLKDSLLTVWMDYLKSSRYVSAAPATLDAQEFAGETQAYYEQGGTEKINDFLEAIHYDQRIQYTNIVEDRSHTITSPQKILFYQREGLSVSVPFIQESLGNRALIKVLTAYLPVLEQEGLLLIDEFSSGLHNELMNILITYFMKHAKRAQMLMVSHGTNILSNSILRPDQEYSVEFYGTAGSRIHRFSQERPRNSQNIPKMYNSGIFGGKPVYGEENEDLL